MLFIPCTLGLCVCIWYVRRLRRPLRILSYSAILLCTVFSLNFLTLDLRKIGDKFLAYGEDSLTPLEVATAYLAVVGMASGGVLVGAPYAALENLLLLFPNSGKIVFDNDFPASSNKVKRFIDSTKSSGLPNSKFSLVWVSYCQDTCDHGFALNGGTLVINSDSTACQASVEVNVSYKPQYRASTLISSKFLILRVDQAALNALQKLGYLHPYRIFYRWAC
jgi:hypothetical protein